MKVLTFTKMMTFLLQSCFSFFSQYNRLDIFCLVYFFITSSFLFIDEIDGPVIGYTLAHLFCLFLLEIRSDVELESRGLKGSRSLVLYLSKG